MKKVFKITLWSLLAIFLLRIFVVQSYRVDSFSMSSTLEPGDRLLVNKIITGTRLPNSILGLPGADCSFSDAFRIPYFRLPGFRNFKRNDLVIYNDPRTSDRPIDKSSLMISRIAGLPGDTVIFLNKELYINRDKVQEQDGFRKLYRIVTDGQTIPLEFIAEHNLEEPVLISDIGIYDVTLDSVAHEAIQKIPGIKNLRLRKQYFGDSSKAYFPYSSFFNWNRDQFGPVIVPVKGLEVILTIKTVDLYREIIDIYEGNDMIVDFSGITINGRKSDSYTFKNNYYFVLDDNRDNPNDSRIIGFIPESHLLGTSKRILYSGHSNFDYLNKSGVKRLLKKIDK